MIKYLYESGVKGLKPYIYFYGVGTSAIVPTNPLRFFMGTMTRASRGNPLKNLPTISIVGLRKNNDSPSVNYERY